jgi:hypothetical protein
MLFKTGQSGQETIIGNILAFKPVWICQAVVLKWKGQQVLFQDIAATVPVTAPSQPVGAVRNLGSAGGFFTAVADDNTRPIWNGTELVFDGSNDTLKIPDNTHTGDFTVSIWHSMANTFGSNEYFLGAKVGATSNAPHLRTQAVSAFGLISNFGSNFTAQNIRANRNPYGQARLTLMREGSGAGSAKLDFRIADSADYFDTGNTGTTTNLQDLGTICSNRAGGEYLKTKISCVAGFPKALSSTELDKLPLINLVNPFGSYEKVLALNPDVFVALKLPKWRDVQVLFQDTAGTTPVTATSQNIGLVKNLGSAGGNMIADDDASRPVWDGVGGDSTGDAAMSLDIASQSQPMTHVLWIDNFDKLTTENRYPVDSKNGSTVRHQPFGRIGTGGADGNIVAATPDPSASVVNSSATFDGRMVLVANGSSSSLQLDGTIDVASTTINPGTGAMDGVSLFSNRGRTQKVPGRIVGYARFPRILSQTEVDSLSINL